MDHRKYLASVAVALVILFAGCFGGGIFDQPDHIYKVCGNSFSQDEVPDNATVIHFRNNHIRNSEPIQMVIERIYNQSQQESAQTAECLTVNEEEYHQVNSQLQKTLLYHHDPHPDWVSTKLASTSEKTGQPSVSRSPKDN